MLKVTKFLSTDDAFDFCATLGGTIVRVYTENTIPILDDLMYKNNYIQHFHLGYTTRETALEDLAWLDIYGNRMPEWFPWTPGQPDNPKAGVGNGTGR